MFYAECRRVSSRLHIYCQGLHWPLFRSARDDRGPGRFLEEFLGINACWMWTGMEFNASFYDTFPDYLSRALARIGIQTSRTTPCARSRSRSWYIPGRDAASVNALPGSIATRGGVSEAPPRGRECPRRVNALWDVAEAPPPVHPEI